MPGDEGLLDPSEIEAMFGGSAAKPDDQAAASAEAGMKAPPGPAESKSGGMKPFQLQDLGGEVAAKATDPDVNLILDVDLNVRVELGRTRLFIEDVLRLREGSVVPLEKLAGDPVDLYVNGRLMARGEVLVLNDNFCVRISEIVGEGTETTNED